MQISMLIRSEVISAFPFNQRARRMDPRESGSSPAMMWAALLADAAADTAFEEEAPAAPLEGNALQRPPGVFDFPWLKLRGGLGAAGWDAVTELRDVFFRSLVDGHMAAIGVPGDRFISPPSRRTLFDDVEEWLATAGEGEVDPVWRSVLEGRKPDA